MKRLLTLPLLVAALLTGGTTLAHDHEHHMAMAKAAASAPSAVNVSAPDITLVDQDHQSGRFLSDWIGDRVAVLSFTYTDCTTICPVLDNILLQVQNKLGDAVGQRVVLLTVSVDPTSDVPERLKVRSQKLGAGPGWSFLTGDKGTINDMLRALEVYSPTPDDHPPTVFVVDGAQGVWTRLNGFPTPDAIVDAVNGYRTAGLH